MSIGDRLRNLRQKARKSLKTQSETFGVSINTIYRWEHNKATPRAGVLKKMAEHYNVPYEWLKTGIISAENSPSNNNVENCSLPGDVEKELLSMFAKLSCASKYKVIGYVERVCVEEMDRIIFSQVE